MNVKQGDTAIVIASTEPENIGIICEVRVFLGTRGGSWWECPDAWHVVSNGRPFVIGGKILQECGFADKALRPISGLPDAESNDEQVTKPVEQPERIEA